MTTAIISYCSPPEKPRQAWGEESKRAVDAQEGEDDEEKWRRRGRMRGRRGEEEGEESDHSGDSGIDRSDDFCQEPITSGH